MNLSKRLKKLEESYVDLTSFELAFKEPYQSIDEALENARRKYPTVKNFIVVSWIPSN